jgi:hypothetical protein
VYRYIKLSVSQQALEAGIFLFQLLRGLASVAFKPP